MAEQQWPFLAARLTDLACFLKACAHVSGVILTPALGFRAGNHYCLEHLFPSVG